MKTNIKIDDEMRTYCTRSLLEYALNMFNISYKENHIGNSIIYNFTSSKGNIQVEFVNNIINTASVIK